MKNCIQCHNSKPPEAFYKHPQMADGRQGVCKDCHKRRMKIRRLTDPTVQERDRARAKQPHRVAINAARAKRWREENPEAYKAHNSLNNAIRDGKLEKLPCEVCATTKGVHGHHRDYSRPLDVVWLCPKCHHRIHARFPEAGGHHRPNL